MENTKLCVVFVVDIAYYSKFIDTCTQLRTVGKYKGDICLIIGDDLNNQEFLQSSFVKQYNITVKYYPNLQFSQEFIENQKTLDREYKWFQKLFQYHKLNLFKTYFKKWDYIFYLDCGLTIYSDISPMISLAKKDTLLAHSDDYPKYERKLWYQFDKNKKEYEKLINTYKMDIDYPQTTIMLFDTSIIEDDTFDNLFRLTNEYPISITNDQGIIALYYTCIKPVFKPISLHNENTFFYDYFLREYGNPYIMVKDTVFGH